MLERRISVKNVAALYREEKNAKVPYMFLVIVIVLDFLRITNYRKNEEIEEVIY